MSTSLKGVELAALARLADRWLAGDSAARSALRDDAATHSESFLRAYDAMVQQLARGDTEAIALDLSQFIPDEALERVSVAAEAIASMTSLEHVGERASGQRVGPYRLLRELGRGGMGVVWLAERADGQHTRQVALKMPLVENLNWLLAARFARERNILASLEHPGIARLYDAGIDNEVQPYIAIEYVQGKPITEYVQAARLRPDTIANLFILVIDAVAHAHAQLVIHRDIKPGNVLVDDKGQPHLLDFGIAKLLDDEDAGGVDATQLTRIAGRALTLDYASPEQVNAKAIGTASDIYSLGVVLYELLTGERPYLPKGDTRRDLECAILEQQPPRPSNRLRLSGTSEASRSARQVRGDLDTIVLKALQKEPRDRYATAQAFADDLRRYLAYEPITAKPESEWYRMRKFVRRNRIVAVMAALTVTTMIAALLVTLSQKREVELQREEVSFRAAQAVATNEFFFGFLNELRVDKQQLTPKQLIDKGVFTLQRRYAGDKAFTALMQAELATIYARLGEVGESSQQRQAALSSARQQSDPLVLAQVLCGSAPNEIHAGRFDSARKFIDEATHLRRAAAQTRIETESACKRAEAALFEWTDRHGDGILRMRELVAYLEAKRDTQGLRYVSALNDLGHFLTSSNQPVEGLEHIRHAGRVLDATGRSYTLARVVNLQSEAFALDRFGELLESRALFEESYRRLYGGDMAVPHGDSAYGAMDYGISLYKVADTGALPWLRFAAQKAAMENDKNTEMQARTWMVFALVDAGALDEAASQARAALTWFSSGPHQRFLQRARLAQTALLLAQGEREKAAKLCDDLLRDAGYPERDNGPALPGLLKMAALSALANRDYVAALHYAKQYRELARKMARDASKSGTVGAADWLIARAHFALGDREAALAASANAARALRAGLGAQHRWTVAAEKAVASGTAPRDEEAK